MKRNRMSMPTENDTDENNARRSRVKRMLLAEVYVHQKRRKIEETDDSSEYEVFHIYEVVEKNILIQPRLATNCNDLSKVVDALNNATGSDTPQMQRLISKLMQSAEKEPTKNVVKQEVGDISAGNGIQLDFTAKVAENVQALLQQDSSNEDSIDKVIEDAVNRILANDSPGKNNRNATPVILTKSAAQATVIEPNVASIDLENATISMTANGHSNKVDATKKQAMTSARFIRIDSSTGAQKICRPIIIKPVNAIHNTTKPAQPIKRLSLPSSSMASNGTLIPLLPPRPIEKRKQSINNSEQPEPTQNAPTIIQPRLSLKPLNELMPTTYKVVKTSAAYVGTPSPRIIQAVSLMPPRSTTTTTQSATTNSTKKPVRVLNGLISMPKDFDTTLTLNQLGVDCVQTKRITATPQIEQVYGGATKLFNDASFDSVSKATSTVPLISSVTSLNVQAGGAVRSIANKQSANGQKGDIANRPTINGTNENKTITKNVPAIAAVNEPKINGINEQKRSNENGQKRISEKGKKNIAGKNAHDDDDDNDDDGDFALMDLRCNICVFLSKTPIEFTEHMLHEHNKPFVCRVCHKIFNSKAYLEIHKADGNCSNKLNADRSYVCIVPAPKVVIENNEKALHCKSCPHVFPDERNYVHHAQQHATRFRCKLCKEHQVFNMDDMKKHLEAHYLAKMNIC